MGNCLISVIMPAYNAEMFVRQAIESVLEQTHSNLELLIINDGSTDATEEIIAGFKDIRIRYFKQLNSGVSSARNIGLQNMKGEYFCFLDADDIFLPNSLKARLEIFESAKTPLNFVDGAIEITDMNLNRLRLYVPNFKGSPFNELIALRNTCYLKQSWLIKRVANKKYKMEERLTHGEDLFFSMEISRFGGIYDYTNETILLYRRHNTSAMANLDGLDKSYRFIFRSLLEWKEVPDLKSYLFHLKSRKIMFLSFLFDGGSAFKAIRSLFK